MKKIISLLIIMLVAITAYSSNSNRSGLFVSVSLSRVQKKASAFSTVIGLLKHGVEVTPLKKYKNWLKVRTPSGNVGYVSRGALVSRGVFISQLTGKDRTDFKKGAKGFSEDDELTAGTKGFSEDDILTAGTKGFSEDDELTAGTKGFKKVEKRQQKRHDFTEGYQKLDEIENNLTKKIIDPQTQFREFRELGELGEFK